MIYVWPIMLENYDGDYYAGTAGVIEIPIWPFMAVVVLGAAATAVQFLIDAWRNLQRACGQPGGLTHERRRHRRPLPASAAWC